MTLLIESLEETFRDRHDFYVDGNRFRDFSETQVRSNDLRGPDVLVVMGCERLTAELEALKHG
ncbi:MAG: hypothetical protein FJ104_04035 [Deltaproteobacteria bacterium]|nr:hypothetical protein [Deltaproteobacteria bacterium]